MELIQHLVSRTRGSDLHALATDIQEAMLLESLPTTRISDPVRVAFEIAAEEMRVPSTSLYRRGLRRERDQRVRVARQLAMYLLWHVAKLSTIKIAQEFGLKDHTTVLYGRDATERRMIAEPGFAARVRDCVARCAAARDQERRAS